MSLNLKKDYRPTLVIGLGGLGALAVRNAKLDIKDDLTEEFIRYLVIDSDITTKTPDMHDNEFVYVGCPSTYQIGTQLPSWLDAAVAKDLDRLMRSSNGSTGGIRQIGRLLLRENREKVRGVLLDAIREITDKSDDVLAIRILTGMYGGTGSGMYMDVACFVREIIRRDFPGTLFTIELTAEMPNMLPNAYPQTLRERFCRIGYQAFRELKYCLIHQYPAGCCGTPCKAPIPLFDEIELQCGDQVYDLPRSKYTELLPMLDTAFASIGHDGATEPGSKLFDVE